MKLTVHDSSDADLFPKNKAVSVNTFDGNIISFKFKDGESVLENCTVRFIPNHEKDTIIKIVGFCKPINKSINYIQVIIWLI